MMTGMQGIPSPAAPPWTFTDDPDTRPPDMAESYLKYGGETRAKEPAENIIEVQREEIDQMEKWPAA